jgi:heterogeneous nuclear ribonucleoprotein A1/A3
VLDFQELHGRRVRVNYANERPRGYGGGGGSYGNASYGGGGGYAGSQYGGGGGYAGSQYGGASSGGGYGGNVDGGYGGGGYGGGSYGPGGNYGGSGAANNYSAPNSFETNNTGGGLEYGSSGQDITDVGDPISNVNEDITDVGHPIEGNYREDGDDTDNFAKRA